MTRILCAGLVTVDLVYRVGRIPGVDEKAQASGFDAFATRVAGVRVTHAGPRAWLAALARRD